MFRKSLLFSTLWISALGLLVGAGPAVLRAQEAIEETESTPNAFEQLLDTAEIVALIKVQKVNDEAAAADGPVYVDVQVIKLLRGALPTTGNIRFGASAWVGPNYKPGETRIVFLNRVGSEDRGYYTQSIWHSIETGKLDIFYLQDDINASTEAKLREGLSGLEGEAFGVQVDFHPRERHGPVIVARQREEPLVESLELEAEMITEAPEAVDPPIADLFQGNSETQQ